MTLDHIYRIVDDVIERCRSDGSTALADDLSQSKQLGSSALEILGAIRSCFIKNREQVAHAVGDPKVADVIEFIDRAFGRT